MSEIVARMMQIGIAAVMFAVGVLTALAGVSVLMKLSDCLMKGIGFVG